MQEQDLYSTEEADKMVEAHRLSKLVEMAENYNLDCDPDETIDSKHFNSIDELIFSLWAREQDVGILGYGEYINKAISGWVPGMIEENDRDVSVYELEKLNAYIFFKHPTELKQYILTTLLAKLNSRSGSVSLTTIVGDTLSEFCESVGRRIKEKEFTRKFLKKFRIWKFLKKFRIWKLEPIELLALFYELVNCSIVTDINNLGFIITGEDKYINWLNIKNCK